MAHEQLLPGDIKDVELRAEEGSPANASAHANVQACCGLVRCGGACTSWRGSSGNRTAWKALCTAAFTATLLYNLYLIGPFSPIGNFSPPLAVCAMVFLVKGWVEIWGQDTPTWICPGSVCLFIVIYVFGIPSILLGSFGLCTQQQDILFSGRGLVAVGLNVFGSSYSLSYEMHRFRWKAKPENKGRLHTTGLASYCIHPNYFGDIFTYMGWSLAAGTWCSMSTPLAMVFYLSMWVIPNSDAYLAQRYPGEFPAYADATATLIPGIKGRNALLALGWLGFFLSVWAGSTCNAAQCGS